MPGVFDPLPPVIPAPPTGDPPTVETAAEDYYRRLAPVAQPDPDNGYALLILASSIAAPVEVVHQVLQETDTHRPWELALDPDNAPAEFLPWLAQPAGVTLRPSDTEAQQRARIKAAAGLYAGTEQAIKDEVALTLTGSKTVRVAYPSQWGITVVTATAETPDPDASERSAKAQEPAGFLITYIAADDPIIDEGGAARTIDLIGSAGTTIDAIALADWI